MSQLTRALRGNPDRNEEYRKCLGMYVAALLITSVVILVSRI